MLKGIDPLLSPELLWLLAAMGHGDEVAVVDWLHPAERVGRSTATGRIIRLPGLAMEQVVRAILTVLPLDDFVLHPVRRMEVVGRPDEMPEVQLAVQREVEAALGQPGAIGTLERFAFYAAAQQAFGVVQVGDTRPYGCFLFRKGVVRAT
jgi:L-fucose mutarotase